MAVNNERSQLLQSFSDSETEDQETPSNSLVDVPAFIPAKITSKAKLEGPLEISASNRRVIIIIIWFGVFIGALNNTLGSTLINSISSEFNASNQAGWLGTSYLLATCTFSPLYGHLSDIMGRRGATQAAIFLAGFGNLLCGLSPNFPTLILARFITGMGGGGVFTTATVITGDIFSVRERGLAQGISFIFSGIGGSLGGLIGGFFDDRFGWRWAFLIQLPLFVIAFHLSTYNLRYITPGSSHNAKDILKRIDIVGSLFLFLLLGSLLFFLSYRYNDDLPFTSPSVIISMIALVLTFIGFLVVELYIAPKPVLAPFLLKSRTHLSFGLSNLVGTGAHFVLYFLPMYFETVLLTSASEAGAHIAPISIAISSAAFFVGWSMTSTGHYKFIDTIFGIGPFLSNIWMSQLNQHSSAFSQWFSGIPQGLGFGLFLQISLVALPASVDRSALGVVAGFGQLWRYVGQVWGVAIASAIFQSILARELKMRIVGPDSEEIARRIRCSSKIIVSLPPEIQSPARESYGIALSQVFRYTAFASLASYLIRLSVPEIPLNEFRPSRDSRNDPSENAVSCLSDVEGQGENNISEARTPA